MDPSPGAAAAAEAAAPGAPPREAAAGAGGVEALRRSLFTPEGWLHAPGSVRRIAVSVDKANRLELNAVRWAAPHVEVTLGGARRRSPACPGPSGEPEAGSVCSPLFGWRTQFRLNGDSVGGHLVFEVKSGSSVLGTSIVPLDAVFREEVFQRALPLLHSGRSRAPAGGDPELLVTIRCLPKEAHASAEDAARRALADQLRLSCSQLRVTLRSLRLYGAAVNAAALRPYVKVAVGLQSGATMAALSSTERDAEEFVFVNPDDRRFDCGSLLGGRYEAPPRNEPRGSKTVPAYQRRAGNDVQVSYRNVRFVFWQFQQDQLDLDVYDEHPLFIDRRIALASLELDDLLLLPFQDDNGTAPLPSLPGKAAWTTGLVTAPLHADGAADDDQIGEMQLEVEFLQDPLALPSPLEALWRRMTHQTRSSHRLYDAALAAVAATAPDAALAEGPLGDARLLPLGVREALAALVVAAALSGVRASARHEDDAAGIRDRLVSAVVFAAEALGVEGQPLALLFSSVESPGEAPSKEGAAEAYSGCCRGASIDPLVPLAALLAETLRRGGCSATLRSALMDAAAAVAPPEVAGRRFLGMMERRLIRATGVAGTLAPEVPAPMSECPSSTERAAAARAWHEGELPVGGLAPAATARRAQAQSFLPTVDWSRLLGRDGREPHPSDKTQLLPGCQAPLYGGTIGFGALSGILGSASAYFTAIAVKGLDENVLCNPDYHKFIPPMKPVCHAVMRSDLDEMIGTYIGSSQGALTFFVAWGLYMGWEAHSRLSLRYQVIRELALEPMGPPTSQLAVVCASGFLTSQADVFLPWEVDSDNPWTEGQVFAVRFDTPVLLRLGTHLVGLLSRVANQAMVAAQVALAVSTPPTLCQTLLYSLVTELDDVFDLAIKRAEQAGRALAQQLVVPVPARPGPPRPATLVGYSVGAVLVHACLRELRRLADSGEAPHAADVVCDVVLIGAPIAGGTAAEWAALRQLASGRFVNGFLPTDQELRGHAQRRFSAPYAGYRPLSSVPGVENVVLSEFVSTHLEYARQTPVILSRLLQG